MIANLNNQPLPDQNQKQVQSQISGVLVALDDPFDKMVWDFQGATTRLKWLFYKLYSF